MVGEWVAFEAESVDPEWLAHPCRDLGPWEDCRGGAPGRWAPGPPSTSLDGSGRYYGWNTLPFGEGHLVSWWFGYNSSALLFREYAARYREATGVPFLEALGVVVRAAMLGFHGLEAGAGRGLIPTVSGVVPGLDPGEAHLQAVLGDMNLKEQVPMPERYMWHGGRTVWFNMHLLAGLGTDYTQTISRMSHGLFSYDVPEGHGFGRLELITNASGMQYLILRLE